MKEVKENLKKTINETCEWIQNELKSEEMSPEVVAAIPETINSLAKLISVYVDIRNY